MSEEVKKPVYNLTGKVYSPADEQAMTIGNPPRPMCIRDAIVTAFKMPVSQEEKISEADLNFNRKIIKKLSKASMEELESMPLKSKAIEAIKNRCRQYYVAGVSMQIYDVFDAEPTQAEMDEV